MRPDADFLKKLKAISPDLEAIWTHGLDRWVIWYTNPNGQRHRIHEVKNPDGSFRPLDERTLQMLERCDMSRQADNPSYIASKQYQRMKEAKERITLEQRDRHRERSKMVGKKKWADAVENASRGIFNERQLDRKIISIPNIFGSTKTLLKKLGKPHLTGPITYL